LQVFTKQVHGLIALGTQHKIPICPAVESGILFSSAFVTSAGFYPTDLGFTRKGQIFVGSDDGRVFRLVIRFASRLYSWIVALLRDLSKKIVFAQS
jgi:hypothetical protein